MANDYEFVYNGLTIGGATKYAILSVEGLGGPTEIRQDLTEKAGADGGFHYATYYTPRTVVIEGDVADATTTALDASLLAIKTALLPQSSALPLVFKRPGIVQQRVYVKPQRLSIPMTTDFNLGLSQWTMMFVAADPLLYADTAGSIAALAPAGTSVANNAGIKPTLFETCVITGPGTTFTIKDNAVATKKLVINTTLTGGQTITIDWKQRTIIHSVGAQNLYEFLSLDSQWWSLAPGNTTVAFTVGSGSSGATKVDLTWRSAWI